MKAIETITTILLIILMQSAIATFVIVEKQAGFSEGYRMGFYAGSAERLSNDERIRNGYRPNDK